MNAVKIVPQVKPLTKEEILARLHVLEVKADVYSRNDWEAYNTLLAEIKDLDMKLLDIYTTENITWLNKQKA